MSWKEHCEIVQGDITEMKTDAIVNAANNDLQLGGGVAGAIRKRGGTKIQAECNTIGPVPLGEAAITTGGNLPAKYVIHAASMRLGGRTTDETLRQSTRNSLKRAEEKGLSSIAFPAIGTGIAGFPLKKCAQIMFEEVKNCVSRETTLKKVIFVLYDRNAYEVFQQIFSAITD